MLMFSRVATLVGSPRRTMPWAIQITDYVNAHGSVPVSCWAGNYGYPIGTVAWGAFIDTQETLVANMSSLLADPAYLDLVEAAADMVGAPGQDHLREIIYGTPPEPAPVGSVGTVTTGVALVERLADAIGWAVDMAQYVESVLGTPVGVLNELYGTLGTLNFIGTQPDLAAVDEGRAKLQADAGYLDKVAGSKGLFIPGSGHVSLLTRIA